ncbi:GntR family transcriptional regulator [Rhodobacteraceae bacterium CCMM004]|nr:GntR family transcriptional regulator [Rhodobacteraceae bacterium CCMM004]
MTDETLAAQIADRLRRDILRGRLAPGAPLKERDNAADMGVSRTPMREAIRILSREGLVVLRPSRSPVVADPTLEEVRDDMDVLLALEVLSGRLACTRASNADIGRVAQIQEGMAAAFDTADDLDRFEIDMAFHRSIAEASHNASLVETHSAYLGRLWRARFLSARQSRNVERVLTQHDAILAGLTARDPDRTAAAIDVHLSNLVDNISALFQAADEARMQQKERLE